MEVRCETQQAAFFPPCSFLCGTKRSPTDAKRSWCRARRRRRSPEVQSGIEEQLRHDCVLQNSKPQEPSPCVGAHDPADAEILEGEQHSRMHRIQNFQHGGPEKLIGADDRRHVRQETRGVADCWYLHDGDILCHPVLVLPYLQTCDATNAKIGAERNQQKTEVIYHVLDLDTAPLDWKISEVRFLASVDTAPPSSKPFYDSENPTAQLYLQKKNSPRIRRSRQQAVQGLNGPTIANPNKSRCRTPPSMMTTSPNTRTSQRTTPNAPKNVNLRDSELTLIEASRLSVVAALN